MPIESKSGGHDTDLLVVGGGYIACEFASIFNGLGASVIDGIGLSRLGIAQPKDGAIFVDDHYRTNVPHILALGDVTASVQLTLREPARPAATPA